MKKHREFYGSNAKIIPMVTFMIKFKSRLTNNTIKAGTVNIEIAALLKHLSNF